MADLYKKGFTQNRELSWLRFNDRVLAEATDQSVPLLERLRFISIFTSNLDEFFMIRVGSLTDMADIEEKTGEKVIDNKSGMTPDEQLEKIFEAVRPLCGKRERIFFEVERQLRAHGIYQLGYDELEQSERKNVKKYFEASVRPILSPQIVDAHHPFPHLANNVIHIGVMLRHKNKEIFGVIPVPASLPPLFYLPGTETRCIRTENIIFEYAESIFDPYTVKEKVIFRVTRNADVNPEDEVFADETDFKKRMRKALRHRRRLAPVRLELSGKISGGFSDYFREKLGLTSRQIYITKAPMKMGYVSGMIARLPKPKQNALTYPKFTPVWPGAISRNESMIRQLERHDILLSYPFDSMEPFLNLVKEAAADPDVISIKITIYRLASHTKLVEHLCEAAEKGKDVTALIELRARFDEQNNIDWSERLEEAGCNVTYGFDSYKVHSKVCLITRNGKTGVEYITQIGTGNYNENTAKQYTDLSLMTSDQRIGRDAAEFFKDMAIANLSGRYDHLLVAPESLKKRVLKLIDEETSKGEEGRIFIKINSLTDADIIDRLSRASAAGARIDMVVRGICCLLPGIAEKTENIRVCSIVGRYLEHSRIYCFGSGEDEKMYISSADFMTRNTQRRVEVACPVYDKTVRKEIHKIIEAVRNDNVKGRMMMTDGTYAEKINGADPFDSQQYLMDEAGERAMAPEEKPPVKKSGKGGFLRRFFGA